MSLTTSARPRIRVETTSRVRGLRLDWVLLLAVAGLLTAGALLVWSATSSRELLVGDDPQAYLKKQLVNIAIGIVLGLMVTATDHRWVRILAPLVYVASVVGLLLDTGHATWGGSDPVVLARKYKSRIGHFHAKDVRPAVRAEAEKKDWSFLDSVIAGVYTVPGDGMVDYVAVFKELPGYSGWVVVEAEQDPKKAEPAKYAKLGYDNLVRFLKAGGLT